jgi:hypothetical protein
MGRKMTIETYDQEYFEFHQQLLNAFIDRIKNEFPFNQENCAEDDTSFLNELMQLRNTAGIKQLNQGQELFCKIVATYPHFMPIVPRDLLWFFGGDCLHYMPDEEILIYQELDELRQAAIAEKKPFSYAKARLKKKGLR